MTTKRDAMKFNPPGEPQAQAAVAEPEEEPMAKVNIELPKRLVKRVAQEALDREVYKLVVWREIVEQYFEGRDA